MVRRVGPVLGLEWSSARSFGKTPQSMSLAYPLRGLNDYWRLWASSVLTFLIKTSGSMGLSMNTSTGR